MNQPVDYTDDPYLDVVQNLEFAIAQAYKADRSVLDRDVMDALDESARRYGAQASGREASPLPLARRAEAVLAAISKVCEWRLGRGIFPEAGNGLVSPVPADAITHSLRKIRKSVTRWHKQGGRQGYLTFIEPYMP